MKIIKAEDIVHYKKFRNIKNENFSDEQMAQMVNYFSEGAITRISNEICDLIENRDVERMERGLSNHCRCGSCYSFQFIDYDNNVVKEVEFLTDLDK